MANFYLKLTLILALTINVNSLFIQVNSSIGLTNALLNVKPGDTIILADGITREIKLQ